MAARAARPALALLLCAAAALAKTVPANTVTFDTRACQPPFDALPFCDTRRSVDERVDDLIARIWAANASVIPAMLTARNKGASALPSLGLPEYDWGLNCIHGVQSSCVMLADNMTLKCPTSFPNPVNYGSAWNKSLTYEMGRVVGLEARALWLLGAVEESPGIHIGLDCWSPNINIARDPRWGRNQEVASEAPLINGDFGSQYTQGLQFPRGGDANHMLVAVTLKHWDAYSLENSDGFRRDNFNAQVSDFALQSTYFPAFRQSVIEGNAQGVMCSYNAVNGVPTCASPFLTSVLRDTWGFTGYVTSDSGALEDIANQHHFTNSSINSVPVALREGQCDVCSGGIYQDYLLPALAAGLVAREDIDLALAHTLRLRFRLGLFDPPSATNPYWTVGPEVIGTPAAQALNLLTTQESMVLLKHDGMTLPLAKGRKIGLIGPHSNATTDMTGNYLGQLCPDNSFDCLVSPYMAMQVSNVGGTVTMAKGCAVNSTDSSGFAAAVALAQASDIIVLALGIDDSIEAEAHDRVNIELPLIQHQLVAAVLAAAAGKPVAVFLLNGGPVDISTELANAGIGAVLSAGYPGTLGGQVIADSLFGDNDHLGGKTAVTWYEASYVDQILMSDMELTDGVGRGDRFFAGSRVVPFGFGLALTSFLLQPLSGFAPGGAAHELATERAFVEGASPSLSYSVNVTNTGLRTGDEVVQLYFMPLETPAQPASRLIRELVDYQRVHLAPGASQTVSFAVSSKSLRMVDAASGDWVSTPGRFELRATNGHDQTLSQLLVVTGREAVVEAFPARAAGRGGRRSRSNSV